MKIKYPPEVREILKLAGMTDSQINQEEVRLSQHEKDILNGKLPMAETSENLQKKFDSGSFQKIGD
jgi:hypothetical protein